MVEELEAVLQQDQTFFYEKISFLKDDIIESDLYTASWTPHNGKKDFIFLNKKTLHPVDRRISKNPKLKSINKKYGWKLHMRIDATQNDDNLRNAWNAIINILIEHQIVEAKIITAEVRQKVINHSSDVSKPDDLGKEITVYIFKNPEKLEVEWQRFIEAIEKALKDANIRPGAVINPLDRAIQGSIYLAHRDDTPLHLERKPNPLMNVEIGRLSISEAIDREYAVLPVNQEYSCSPCCRK